MQKGNRTQGKKFIYTEEQKGAGVTQMSCEDQRIKEAKTKMVFFHGEMWWPWQERKKKQAGAIWNEQ